MSGRLTIASGGEKWLADNGHGVEDFDLREAVLDTLEAIKRSGVSHHAAAHWVAQVSLGSQSVGGDFVKWSAATARDLGKHGWGIFDFDEEGVQ